ncbi:MAG: ComF family protein [Planctomycetota bacterium]|nr:MAG: ComF family protein [Planctomycetota bacterium]
MPRSGGWEPSAGPERLNAAAVGLGQALGGAWSGLLDLASPRRCAACSAIAEELLCPPCLRACEAPVGPCCRRCGEAWRLADEGGCGRCRRFGRTFAFRRAAALWAYRGPVRRVVHGFKFEGRADVLPGLGARMLGHPVLGAWARGLPGALIVPVPAGAASGRRRGYDQAALLAAGVARSLGRRATPRALRRRRQPLASQARSAPEARRGAVRAAFEARPALVHGRHVLLVDDVLSTGATADAASRALRCSGAREVSVLALAT